MPIPFDSQQLPPPQPEYVAWVDVMGIAPLMGRSFHISANFIFKLHIAALQSPRPGITLFPIMDGIYIVSPDQTQMLEFLTHVFNRCAEEFLSQNQPFHQFLIRGALACGLVIRGQNVPNTIAAAGAGQQSPLTAIAGYKDSLLMGLPMVQAHVSEKLAPPFGLYVHESARSFAPMHQQPMKFVWWNWSNPPNPNWVNLVGGLRTYFDWCKRKSLPLEYAGERVAAHLTMVEQYFS